MPRLFVAAWLPPPVVEVLAALPRPAEPGVRWVPPEQWHVTLRFLGAADLDEARAALAQVAAAPVDARLGPRVSRLGRNVVCVPVHGLDAVAAAVVRATAVVGQPPDPRPFAGHVTLARLRHRAACGLAGAAVAAAFTVTELALVSSVTRAEGPTYTTELTHPLRAPS